MLYHGLTGLGVPVVCIESRQAYQALKSLAGHKTDRNDARGLETSQMLALATEHAVIRTDATGGVCCPIARLSVTTRPKCTGSMPTAE